MRPSHRMGIAAGLIDDEHPCLGTGLDIDGIVPRAIAGDDQEIRRPPQQVALDVEMTGEFVARSSNLIGMRRRQLT